MAEEHEHRSEDEVLSEQTADAVEDLDVPEGQAEDVSGGNFKQAWPVKWQGGP
jgi:hypothetical protein